MAEQTFKRRQYLVDPQYQLWFATRLFAMLLFIAVLTAAIAGGVLWANLYEPDLAKQTTLIASMIAVAATLLIELLVAIPIVFYLGIRQSHRVVGPIARMKRTLEALGEGDYSQRIYLRKGDVLIEIAQSINSMAEQIKQRHGSSSSS